MEDIHIDLLIPCYKDIDSIKTLIESFSKQKNVVIENIVCILTTGSDNDCLIKKYFEENNIIYFEINKSEFSHSLSREKAIKEYCKSNIVVLLSQDITLVNEYSLFNLVRNIDDKVVYAFGRQLCPKKCIEKYIRNKNYPEKSYKVRKEDIDRMQIMAFFSSDAFSAINKEAFIKIGGYNNFDVMMGEDMLFSYFLLEKGYEKMYCSDAEVIHYHNLTIKQLYNRYYQTGCFYRQVKFFNEYKSNNAGLKLAMYVLGQCFAHFCVNGIFRWLFDMSARYFGMKKGRKG